MKRLGYLIPEIATLDNVAVAFHRAYRGRRSSPEARRFEANLDSELPQLVEELGEGLWMPAGYQRFTVRDPKVRVIHAAAFRDRVAHHAMLNVAGPILESGATGRSYACRPGRGNRAALAQAAREHRSTRWYLKLDIRKYFDSIRHGTLCALLRRRFKDPGLLDLFDRIIASYSVTPDCGLPIGTLTSQYFANFYLDALDHHVLQDLKGASYVRYMDDFVLWHEDRETLSAWRDAIAEWLNARRGLLLKSRAEPTRCSAGLSFLGYRVLSGRVLLGRRARRRFASRLRTYEQLHSLGQLGPSELQRRVDALLAVTDMAACLSWRRRVVATQSSRSREELWI